MVNYEFDKLGERVRGAICAVSSFLSYGTEDDLIGGGKLQEMDGCILGSETGRDSFDVDLLFYSVGKAMGI